jgi:hypothetical protein
MILSRDMSNEVIAVTILKAILAVKTKVNMLGIGRNFTIKGPEQFMREIERRGDIVTIKDNFIDFMGDPPTRTENSKPTTDKIKWLYSDSEEFIISSDDYPDCVETIQVK